MAAPKYEVTVTSTFTFDTSEYYDVDDGVENFDPQDEDSIHDYISDNFGPEELLENFDLRVKRVVDDKK